MQLAVFIGVLLTLSRWYRDNEMAVLAACGTSIMDLVRPVMLFTLVAATVLAIAVLVIRPAAFVRIQEIRQENLDQSDLDLLAPGQFTVMDGQTFYIESRDAGEARGAVFVQKNSGSDALTIVAKKAAQTTDRNSGQRQIELIDGTVYAGRPGTANYRVTSFERYQLQLETNRMYRPVDHVESVPLLALPDFHDTRRGITELQTRLSKPLMLFVFAGIAMVLSYSDPRRSHYRSLFIAVLVFFLYLTILQTVRDMMKVGTMPLGLGLWWVHVVAGALIYFLLRRRLNGLRLIPIPGRVKWLK
jgi:lipopolysaccharide export system permease protein